MVVFATHFISYTVIRGKQGTRFANMEVNMSKIVDQEEIAVLRTLEKLLREIDSCGDYQLTEFVVDGIAPGPDRDREQSLVGSFSIGSYGGPVRASMVAILVRDPQRISWNVSSITIKRGDAFWLGCIFIEDDMQIVNVPEKGPFTLIVKKSS